MLTPVFALVIWTLLVWILMYARRIPAMNAVGMKPDEAKFPGTYADRLPDKARAAADNYNHLLEQPVLFYALMFYHYFTGSVSPWVVYLGWAYVALRGIHSAVQVSVGPVVPRFVLFVLGTLVLFGLVGVAII